MAMFSKLLTTSDMENNLLNITTNSADNFPFGETHFFYMSAVDNGGHAWTFPCFLHQNDGVLTDEKPFVISIGWTQYIKNKDIRVGDMVFLHRKFPDDADMESSNQFRIEVKRKIRLLGQDIWAAVDDQ